MSLSSILLPTLLSFAHIAGAVLVLGGLTRALISGLNRIDSYRPWLTSGALVLAFSGAWQFALRMHGAPAGWHAVAGIKILLALHVLAVSILLGREGLTEHKRARLARTAVLSGWVVALLGTLLHNLK